MSLLTPDIEPLWISRNDYEAGWRLPRHVHEDYFQLIFIQSGQGEAFVGEGSVRFETGNLLFIKPTLSHGLYADTSATVRTLDTKFRIKLPALRRACQHVEPVQTSVDPNVVPLLEAMLAEAKFRGDYTTEVCQSIFAQLIFILLRSNLNREPSKTRLPIHRENDTDLCGRMERYLRERCAEKIDQPALSAALHYSYRHLHEAWRQRHSVSPLQSLWHFRVERAVDLIRYSDYELKRIAQLAGFASVHHFTRVFTRIVGESPARWRKRERSGIGQDVLINPTFVNRVLTIRD